MYTTLYIKNEFIENYNLSHKDKIINNICKLMKQVEDNCIVFTNVDNPNYKYRIINIPNKYLMIDINGIKL